MSNSMTAALKLSTTDTEMGYTSFEIHIEFDNYIISLETCILFLVSKTFIYFKLNLRQLQFVRKMLNLSGKTNIHDTCT